MSGDRNDGSGALSDDKADALLDQLAKRADKRDDLNLRSQRGVSRRETLAGLLGIGGLGTAAMSQRAQAAGEDFTNASGTVGTDTKPLGEVNAKQGDFQSLSTEQGTITSLDGTDLQYKQVGDAPFVFSSGYATYQDALDATGGGTLIFDDSKREEGITFKDANDGAVLYWPGPYWVDKPTTPTDGVATFSEDANNSTDLTLTFVRPHIRNPDLGDADIQTWNTLAGPDRRSAIEWGSPVGSGTGKPTDITVIDPHIHHVQGYGIALQDVAGSFNVRGGNIEYTAYDSLYEMPNSVNNPDINWTDVTAGWSGRHNFACAGSAEENQITITGSGTDAWTAGIDFEQATKASVDVDIFNPTRSGETGNINAGVTGGIRQISGRATVHDPNNYGIRLGGNGRLDGFTGTVVQSAAQNPNNSYAIESDFTGNGSFNQYGGGSDKSAILIINNTDGTGAVLDIYAEDTYGASVLLSEADANNIDITSYNPVQAGSANVSQPYFSTHVALSDGARFAVDNQISVVAVDTDNNADYAVSTNGGTVDNNRYSGVVRRGYQTSATNAIGPSSDITDLIS